MKVVYSLMILKSQNSLLAVVSFSRLQGYIALPKKKPRTIIQGQRQASYGLYHGRSKLPSIPTCWFLYNNVELISFDTCHCLAIWQRPAVDKEAAGYAYQI